MFSRIAFAKSSIRKNCPFRTETIFSDRISDEIYHENRPTLNRIRYISSSILILKELLQMTVIFGSVPHFGTLSHVEAVHYSTKGLSILFNSMMSAARLSGASQLPKKSF